MTIKLKCYTNQLNNSSRLNNAPILNIHILIPGTYGFPYMAKIKIKKTNKTFVDVIKDLGTRRLSGMIQVGSKCSYMYPYKREAEGDLSLFDQGGRIGRRSWAKKSAATRSWDRQRKDSPLEPLEGVLPHWDSVTSAQTADFRPP